MIQCLSSYYCTSTSLQHVVIHHVTPLNPYNMWDLYNTLLWARYIMLFICIYIWYMISIIYIYMCVCACVCVYSNLFQVKSCTTMCIKCITCITCPEWATTRAVRRWARSGRRLGTESLNIRAQGLSIVEPWTAGFEWAFARPSSIGLSSERRLLYSKKLQCLSTCMESSQSDPAILCHSGKVYITSSTGQVMNLWWICLVCAFPR